MKKEYVKPIIESEEFVANEYVAACWTMTCTNSDGSCGTYFYQGDTNALAGLTLDSQQGEDYIGRYTGEAFGTDKTGCRTEVNQKDYVITDLASFIKAFWDWITGNTTVTTAFHPVLVSEGFDNWTEDGKNHPNAS